MNANTLKMLFFFACIGGSAAAIYNVNADVGPLQERAESMACPKSGKCLHLMGLSRSAISQTFTFQVSKKGQTAIIECQRSGLLVGDYSCKKLN